MLFDHSALVRHRNRAAELGSSSPLFEELATVLAERAKELRPNPKRVADIGCRRGEIQKAWRGEKPALWTNAEAAEQLLNSASAARCLTEVEGLPFAENSFDLVFCCGLLHWLNDPPQWLICLSKIMTADGLLLLATPFGGLESLARAFAAALPEADRRFSPLIGMQSLSALLMTHGFSEPVVDKERVRLSYKTHEAILRDLRLNGETNALRHRPKSFAAPTRFRRALELFARTTPHPPLLEADFLIATAHNKKPRQTP